MLYSEQIRWVVSQAQEWCTFKLGYCDASQTLQTFRILGHATLSEWDASLWTFLTYTGFAAEKLSIKGELLLLYITSSQ